METPPAGPHSVETEPGDAGQAVDLDLDRVDLDLSRVEESLRLLDDADVDPAAAIAWTDVRRPGTT